MKKILITGSSGFIGKNFIDKYKNKYEIISISRDSNYDILDIDTFLDISDIDVVLHFAAKTYVPESFENPYSFYRFNINSTLNICEFCRIKKVKKLIFLNSYPYGKPSYLPIDEDHPISLHSPYNKSKYLSEELIFNYLDNSVDVISLRIFNIYGKNQNNKFLIPFIFEQIKDGTITVNDLEPKRDYLYIEDLLSLMDNIINQQIKGIFNVGSGESYNVLEVINCISDILGKEFKIISNNNRRENEIMNCVANIEKIKKILNWSPLFSLKKGLIDYIKKEKIDV
ncbi:UDP-glucose 4-epimerase [Arcobacter venerupis]|uniref:UDP-glucose 4-epimerase n=1 Tax=Arcobacter venerupis TaxID=1054033 RepID=A0AAE7BBW6_9BACT|nr:NAD(P)-dependent oxidoreductase [Arcobacter venerupis]QKF67534.1 UDP-glucose 4-epimerase [Arcobacter venerupis]RWS50456.1 hypothetical protein CKA56_02685 [Arcobacter venerupis]